MGKKTIVSANNWITIGFVIFTCHTFPLYTSWANLFIKLWCKPAFILDNGLGAEQNLNRWWTNLLTHKCFNRPEWVKSVFLKTAHCLGSHEHGLSHLESTWYMCYLLSLPEPFSDIILQITEPGPRLNIKTVLSTYGDFHVKDKTAVRTSYL